MVSPDTGIERELGRLAGLFQGLTDAFTVLRREVSESENRIIQSIAAHDARDQLAFEEIFRRIRPLETNDALERERANEKQIQKVHGHSWGQTFLTIITAILASVITACATIFASRHQ
jgi:hypothetical protein